MAAMASSMVAGIRSVMACTTGSLVRSGHAEIALPNALENHPVLDVQRAIEAELRAQLHDLLRRRALAEHRLDRIPRHEMEEREDERGDAQQDGDGQQEPA